MSPIACSVRENILPNPHSCSAAQNPTRAAATQSLWCKKAGCDYQLAIVEIKTCGQHAVKHACSTLTFDLALTRVSKMREDLRGCLVA